jgi:hypothetical protein
VSDSSSDGAMFEFAPVGDRHHQPVFAPSTTDDGSSVRGMLPDDRDSIMRSVHEVAEFISYGKY